MERSFLTIEAGVNDTVIKALAAPGRLQLLKLLCSKGPLNVNDMARALSLPQSTVATGIQILEEVGLVESRLAKGRKGNQKICSAVYDEILISFEDKSVNKADDVIEVEMPVGLYTSCDIHAPCGLCSSDSVIGLLDVPGLDRVDELLGPGDAGLLASTETTGARRGGRPCRRGTS